jgi:hypothetical protein
MAMAIPMVDMVPTGRVIITDFMMVTTLVVAEPITRVKFFLTIITTDQETHAGAA